MSLRGVRDGGWLLFPVHSNCSQCCLVFFGPHRTRGTIGELQVVRLSINRASNAGPALQLQREIRLSSCVRRNFPSSSANGTPGVPVQPTHPQHYLPRAAGHRAPSTALHATTHN